MFWDTGGSIQRLYMQSLMSFLYRLWQCHGQEVLQMNKAALQEQMQSYVRLRASMGSKSFEGTRLQVELQNFVEYASCHGHGESIRTQLVLDWICARPRGDSRKSALLSLVRNFLIHLKSRFPETEIPDMRLVASPVRPTPYIFSPAEVRQLLCTAQTALGSLCPHTYHTLLGLLASTGVRISEALNLKVSDLYLEDYPPRLLIRETKFSKTRWVPLHATTTKALRRYCKLRSELATFDSEYLFLTERSPRLTYSSCQKMFRRVLARAGINFQFGKRTPSLHSFRHSFANHRLQKWYQAGKDVNTLAPNLSVYLGHINPAATYWYFSATPEMLGGAARLFERYTRNGGEH